MFGSAFWNMLYAVHTDSGVILKRSPRDLARNASRRRCGRASPTCVTLSALGRSALRPVAIPFARDDIATRSVGN
jgi:hypothetical protein